MSRLLHLVVLAISSSAFAAEPFTPEEAAYLTQIEQEIEFHNWLALLDQAEPQHRTDKLNRDGITHAEYIALLLGLNQTTDSIAGDDGFVDPEDLLRLRQISWKRKGRSSGPNETIVMGIATLDDGSTVLVEVTLIPRTEGGFRLTGP